MTVLADIGGADVVKTPAGGGEIVMATDAALGDATMFKGGWHPRIGVVAIVTGIVTGNMVKVLADCLDPIMATVTAAKYLEVINSDHRLPGTGRVTISTNFGRTDVARIFAGGIDAIVTALTTAKHLAMVNPGHRCPPGFQVTILALIGALYMVQR